ncbi:MAG: hypothetical protein P4L40_21545 [Terracidiphilus sp.]|nr:hypothetical protein [Terracidiphilus sp.]
MAAVMDQSAPVEVIERKVCEGFDCGAMFWRPAPVHASLGEKLCPACRAREARLLRIDLELFRQTRGYRLAG